MSTSPDKEPLPAQTGTPFTHTPKAQEYIRDLTTLYTSTDTAAQDAIIDRIMAPDVTFDDNIVTVHKQPSMKVQFHAIAKMLKDVKFEATSSHFKDGTNDKTLIIETNQEYGIGKKVIKLEVTTTLDLDANGLIVNHTDRWHDKFVSFKILKRVLGGTTSTVMKAFKY